MPIFLRSREANYVKTELKSLINLPKIHYKGQTNLSDRGFGAGTVRLTLVLSFIYWRIVGGPTPSSSEIAL